jgi:chromate reductase
VGTTSTINILGIPGSLRQASYNKAALQAAQELLPEGATLEIFGLGGVPPFNEDDERTFPARVVELKARVREADAILIATPEYNSSIPGSLKNALDWVSRPVATNPLRNKPVAVVGASTGAFGAVWAQAELRKVLAAIGARVLDGEVAVGHAPTRFDESGRLEDESLQEQLEETIEALLTEVDARSLVLA